jgi:hypothetical protein
MISAESVNSPSAECQNRRTPLQSTTNYQTNAKTDRKYDEREYGHCCHPSDRDLRSAVVSWFIIMKPVSRDMDITNQNVGPRGLWLFGVAFMANVMTGIIPAIRKFIESNSGRKALRSERL